MHQKANVSWPQNSRLAEPSLAPSLIAGVMDGRYPAVRQPKIFRSAVRASLPMVLCTVMPGKVGR